MARLLSRSLLLGSIVLTGAALVAVSLAELIAQRR